MTAVAPTPTLEDRLDRLSAQVEEITAELRRQREAREQWGELVHELAPVSRDAMDLASRELQELSVDVTVEDFTRFARTAARAVPQLEQTLAQLGSLSELLSEVTSLSGAGMAKLSDALGDNVVLILNTVKEMTQPEVMTMLRRTAVTVQHIDEPLAAPSALALLRQMRDPEVRRGLARAMTMLRTLGEETPATSPQEGPH
ncbi:MAG: DUF1641 domain-containing protein [Actinomycetia bacterium]|nr:DUF1641 domain-containing protein [Actinomycetes bacterium]